VEKERERGMKQRDIVGVGILCTLFGVLAFGDLHGDGSQELDEDRIKGEVAAHFQQFSGSVADQSVELWDDYFLKSPHIGNKHGPDVEVGWEAYHQAGIGFFTSPAVRDGAFDFRNVEVHPITEDVAWAKGEFVSTFGGRETVAVFYDTLIKTDEGWRVILSYVEPPREPGTARD
jgi:hypothetical protein